MAKKVYTITVEETDDGKVMMTRINDGFNIHELLGFCNFISLELVGQIKDNGPKPDIIERKVINPDKL